MPVSDISGSPATPPLALLLSPNASASRSGFLKYSHAVPRGTFPLNTLSIPRAEGIRLITSSKRDP